MVEIPDSLTHTELLFSTKLQLIHIFASGMSCSIFDAANVEIGLSGLALHPAALKPLMRATQLLLSTSSLLAL
jgi:hypothetical protein